MKLALLLGYWDKGPIDRFLELAQRAEALGFESVVTSEAYGSDCFTPLAAIAAVTSTIKLGTSVMQISARTPAAAAMTAITLDHLSNGRLWLGIGVSGPQVVEGWYGQPFQRPLERTREWLQIFRKILAREEPLTFAGRQYQIPYGGPGATGQGKALRSITHPLRADIPVYLGAEGPKNVALAFEQFDGWLPFMLPPGRMDLFADVLAGKKPGFEIVASVPTHISDNREEALRPIKANIALYVGGMGSKAENFHKKFVERMGFGAEAQTIQDLWLAGRQAEAITAVPDAMADELTLVGSPSYIRERLKVYKASGITTFAMTRSRSFEATVAAMELVAKDLL